MDSILQLRRTLHQHPELSGCEEKTAQKIVDFFVPLAPDQIVEGLGGNGLAFVFSGRESGPTVMLRCELDALPIQESNPINYRSVTDGISHKCGHDGHMAILAAVGKALAAKRPRRGKVVLLYQPAEENGKGAAAVIRDPKFARIEPDFAFALHNLPGFPLGQLIVRAGAFNCASRGMSARLSGTTAHAAQPETGRSPATAMCRIIQNLSNLPPDIGQSNEIVHATIVGAKLGEKAFGTAPGTAEIWATLRSESDDAMASLVALAEHVVQQSAMKFGLSVDVEYEDVFRATVNSRRAVEVVKRVVDGESLHEPGNPFRWSEDFGRFAEISHGRFLE